MCFPARLLSYGFVLTELGVPNKSGTVSITVAKVLERLPPDAGRFPVARDFPLLIFLRQHEEL
jgi:hypothetical protein